MSPFPSAMGAMLAQPELVTIAVYQTAAVPVRAIEPLPVFEIA